MKNLLMSFVKEEEGSILEYLILIAIVAIIAAFMFPKLRQNVQGWFEDMLSNVTKGISGTNTGSTSGTKAGF